MTETHTEAAPHGPANVQDSDDLNYRGVAIATAGVIVIVILSCFIVGWIFGVFTVEENEAKKTRYPLAAAARERPLSERWPDDPRFLEAEKALPEGMPLPWAFPKKPRLEGLDTPIELNDPLESGVKGWPSIAPLQAERETRELDTLAWKDKEKGTVTLPIELVLKRLAGNLPVRSSAPDTQKLERYYQTPSAANSGRPPEGGKR